MLGVKRGVRARKTTTDGGGARSRSLTMAHGAFNVAGGLWPLLSLRTFEWVFGTKHDRWLQKTVGGLLLANGISQLAGADSAEGRRRARTLGLATASTLLAVDLIYVPRRQIPATYLLDAAMEVGWLRAWLRSDHTGPTPDGAHLRS